MKGSAETESHEPTAVTAEGPILRNSDAHCEPGTVTFSEIWGLGWSVSAIVLVPPSVNAGLDSVSSGPSTSLFSVPRDTGSYCARKTVSTFDQSTTLSTVLVPVTVLASGAGSNNPK